MHALITEAARIFDVPPAAILGPSRQQHLVQARQAVAYALRQTTQLSLHAIAELVDRDHTTVVYAIAAAHQRGITDPFYGRKLRALTLPREEVSHDAP